MTAIPMDDFGKAVTDIIRRKFGGKRHAAKRLATITDSPVRTAEAWLAGRYSPNANNILYLMADCDELRAEVNRRVDLIREMRGLDETRSTAVENPRA
jgi:hypothetical protein